MDPVTINVLVALFVALITTGINALVTQYRSKLEAKRIKQERLKWLLDLHIDFEKRLHQVRLEEYPAIFSELELLSHFRVKEQTVDSIRELCAKLNKWGYSKAGLCMSANTRDTLFKLRVELSNWIDSSLNHALTEAILASSRTDFIEGLRRDLNHISTWRESLPSLLQEIKRAAKSA